MSSLTLLGVNIVVPSVCSAVRKDSFLGGRISHFGRSPCNFYLFMFMLSETYIMTWYYLVAKHMLDLCLNFERS